MGARCGRVCLDIARVASRDGFDLVEWSKQTDVEAEALLDISTIRNSARPRTDGRADDRKRRTLTRLVEDPKGPLGSHGLFDNRSTDSRYYY